MSTPAATTLDERYGRTPDRRRRSRLGLWIAAVGFAIVLVSWVVWGGLDGAGASVETRDIGHTVTDELSTEVTWEVSLPVGSSASCALEAQNAVHSVVGWKVVDLPASDDRTRQFTETVRTTELAVTGLIYRCWLT